MITKSVKELMKNNCVVQATPWSKEAAQKSGDEKTRPNMPWPVRY
jgi:hypothetical protein